MAALTSLTSLPAISSSSSVVSASIIATASKPTTPFKPTPINRVSLNGHFVSIIRSTNSRQNVEALASYNEVVNLCLGIKSIPQQQQQAVDSLTTRRLAELKLEFTKDTKELKLKWSNLCQDITDYPIEIASQDFNILKYLHFCILKKLEYEKAKLNGINPGFKFLMDSKLGEWIPWLEFKREFDGRVFTFAPGFKLLAHQVLLVRDLVSEERRFIKKNRAMVCAGTGVGKTITEWVYTFIIDTYELEEKSLEKAIVCLSSTPEFKSVSNIGDLTKRYAAMSQEQREKVQGLQRAYIKKYITPDEEAKSVEELTCLRSVIIAERAFIKNWTDDAMAVSPTMARLIFHPQGNLNKPQLPCKNARYMLVTSTLLETCARDWIKRDHEGYVEKLVDAKSAVPGGQEFKTIERFKVEKPWVYKVIKNPRLMVDECQMLCSLVVCNQRGKKRSAGDNSSNSGSSTKNSRNKKSKQLKLKLGKAGKLGVTDNATAADDDDEDEVAEPKVKAGGTVKLTMGKASRARAILEFSHPSGVHLISATPIKSDKPGDGASQALVLLNGLDSRADRIYTRNMGSPENWTDYNDPNVENFFNCYMLNMSREAAYKTAQDQGDPFGMFIFDPTARKVHEVEHELPSMSKEQEDLLAQISKFKRRNEIMSQDGSLTADEQSTYRGFALSAALYFRLVSISDKLVSPNFYNNWESLVRKGLRGSELTEELKKMNKADVEKQRSTMMPQNYLLSSNTLVTLIDVVYTLCIKNKEKAIIYANEVTQLKLIHMLLTNVIQHPCFGEYKDGESRGRFAEIIKKQPKLYNNKDKFGRVIDAKNIEFITGENAKQRDSIIDRVNNVEFDDPNSIRVILSTIKTGSAGINLPGIQRVIELDYKFNPVDSIQGVGRADRPTQTKDIYHHSIFHTCDKNPENWFRMHQNRSLAVIRKITKKNYVSKFADGDLQNTSRYNQLSDLVDKFNNNNNTDNASSTTSTSSTTPVIIE